MTKIFYFDMLMLIFYEREKARFMHVDINVDINIDEVLAFATEKHKGQVRADGSDYITHPIRVSKLVETYKPSKNADVSNLNFCMSQ